MRAWLRFFFLASLMLGSGGWAGVSAWDGVAHSDHVLQTAGPLYQERWQAGTLYQDGKARVNAPYFAGEVAFAEMAVFWFGQVDSVGNYVDVRVGYNDEYLRIRTAAFDRRLWYDTDPAPSELTDWDTVVLYLDLAGDGGNVPAPGDHCYVAQLNWWEARDAYQAVYEGDGSGWLAVTLPFTTTSGWRGDAPNNDSDDRGWVTSFYVPFESLGLPGPPEQGTVWGMAMTLHDRDDAAGTPIADRVWPEAMDGQRPGTWGELAFGLPVYVPPQTAPGGMVTVRQGLDGATVQDGAVGGGSVCGAGLDFWIEWGEANYAGQADFNIQNQADVADWPCFSKYYVTFPLDGVPAGKAIVSATLTLHQFGNSDPSQAEPSLIQVLAVSDNWDEATLTWNNAPLATENVSAAWVDPLPEFPGWPGLPRTWDVSQAVAEAHTAGTPLRLALYEADSAYHSGKYFVTSDTGDWNAMARPTLQVCWGEPVGAVDKTVSSLSAMPGGTLTYTLSIVGSGQPLTLTDTLPEMIQLKEKKDEGQILVSCLACAEYAAGFVSTCRRSYLSCCWGRGSAGPNT